MAGQNHLYEACGKVLYPGPCRDLIPGCSGFMILSCHDSVGPSFSQCGELDNMSVQIEEIFSSLAALDWRIILSHEPIAPALQTDAAKALLANAAALRLALLLGMRRLH